MMMGDIISFFKPPFFNPQFFLSESLQFENLFGEVKKNFYFCLEISEMEKVNISLRNQLSKNLTNPLLLGENETIQFEKSNRSGILLKERYIQIYMAFTQFSV